MVLMIIVLEPELKNGHMDTIRTNRTRMLAALTAGMDRLLEKRPSLLGLTAWNGDRPQGADQESHGRKMHVSVLDRDDRELARLS